MKPIYLDNAATTAVDNKVLKAMLPYFNYKYGNASEYHNLGREAKLAVEKSRQIIAGFLKAKPEEIIFTGSASESINLAIKGLVEANKTKGTISHIIASTVEHKAVLETCKHLERLGQAKVTYLPADQYGWIDPKLIVDQIRPETLLVSIMYVNNEVGTIEPVEVIGQLIEKINRKRRKKIYFHTDATQAIQYLNCQVDDLGVDLLSFSGHKIYTPKGIGVLYKKCSVEITRQIDGGAQETALRAGTENVPYITGLGCAVGLISKNKLTRTQELRDWLISGVLAIPGTHLTGHPNERVDHIASFIIDGVEGEAVVLLMSDRGVYLSTGSACSAADLNSSHVLTAMGYKPEASHGSIRFSLGKETTKEEIDYAIKMLKVVVTKLRKMAPN